MSKLTLIVDDDPMYLELISDVFATKNLPVVSARNGQAALEMLGKYSVDLIICDVNMPVMDGVEFHKSVGTTPRYSKIPFVFLTGTVDPEALAYAKNAGAKKVVKKVNLVPDLLELIDKFR